MKVRHPSFDLAGLRAHWAPNHEWAHNANAAGIIPSSIEPFLIKVMYRAKAQLDPHHDAELLKDIDTFIRQEGQHYKMHEQFNEAIAADGYPGLLGHDQLLKKDYAEFLVTRDLEWLVTYVEAFESIVVVGVPQWVDLGWGETYFSGADERVVRLWRWHLAEEYEHRTVAYRLFKRVCSGTPEEVEQKRVDMLNFFLGHLHQRLLPVRSYLLEVDRASMTPEELAASQQRERQVDARLEEFNAAVADVMAPTWDPAILPPPERLAEAFALVE